MGVHNILMEFIYVLLLMAVLGNAFLVITLKNPINVIFSLIGTFLCAGSLLLFFNLEFFAIIFVAIYIGAIAVFFLFIVMLFNIPVKHEELTIVRWFSVFLGGVILLLVFFFLAPFLMDHINLIQIPEYFISAVSLQDLAFLLFKKYYFYILLVGWYFFVLLVGISMIYRV